MTKFIFKANDDVLSFCECESGIPAMSSEQMDCPWCGCGWLISCSKCRKAFTFAVVRETELSLFEIGKNEVKLRGIADAVTDDEIEDWAQMMKEELEGFVDGQVVVYLDGEYIPIDAEFIEFDGMHAAHKLEALPHVQALQDPKVLGDVLGDSKYWFDRKIEIDEEE